MICNSVTCIHNQSSTCSVQALAQQNNRQVSPASFWKSLTNFFSNDLSLNAEESQSLTFNFYLKFYFHCIVLKYIFTKIWTRQAYKTLYQFHNWISSHQILTFEFLKLLICISAVNFYMASDKFFWIFKSLWFIKIERWSSRHNQTPTEILLRVQKLEILVIKMMPHLPDVSNYPLKRHESD